MDLHINQMDFFFRSVGNDGTYTLRSFPCTTGPAPAAAAARRTGPASPRSQPSAAAAAGGPAVYAATGPAPSRRWAPAFQLCGFF